LVEAPGLIRHCHLTLGVQNGDWLHQRMLRFAGSWGRVNSVHEREQEEAEPYRRSRRQPHKVAPQHDGHEPGKAGRDARHHVPADPEIRKGRQPRRGKPAAGDCLHPQCAAGVFFEDAPGMDNAPNGGFAEESGVNYIVDFLSSSEGLRLNRSFVRISDTNVRKKIVDLVESLAGNK
jgi:hypothetical protein